MQAIIQSAGVFTSGGTDVAGFLNLIVFKDNPTNLLHWKYFVTKLCIIRYGHARTEIEGILNRSSGNIAAVCISMDQFHQASRFHNRDTLK